MSILEKETVTYAIWCANQVFAETALGLADNFTLLGLQERVSLFQGGRCAPWLDLNAKVIWILVGITHIPESWPLPGLYFLYQMEQLTSPWITEKYIQSAMGALGIWEFAPSHIEYWRRSGLSALYVPLSLPLAWLSPSPTKEKTDIDVLFYGSGNERRLQSLHSIQARLAARGYKCLFYTNFDLFGKERDAIVDKAKIVLNIHYYEHASLEVHRLNYLLARGKCVLSEWSLDSHLDAVYAPAVAFAPNDKIADLALALLDDTQGRTSMEVNAKQFARYIPAASAAWLRPIVHTFGLCLNSQNSLSTSSLPGKIITHTEDNQTNLNQDESMASNTTKQPLLNTGQKPPSMLGAFQARTLVAC